MAEFLFDKERLAKLEREVASLKEGLRGTGLAIAIALEEALGQLVDERKITPQTRDEIFNRVRDKSAIVAAKSIPLAQAIHGALGKGQ